VSLARYEQLWYGRQSDVPASTCMQLVPLAHVALVVHSARQAPLKKLCVAGQAMGVDSDEASSPGGCPESLEVSSFTRPMQAKNSAANAATTKLRRSDMGQP
jgi:hypothetical protein